jgi:hypothetical protein
MYVEHTWCDTDCVNTQSGDGNTRDTVDGSLLRERVCLCTPS